MSIFSNVFASDGTGSDNAQVGPSPEPVLPEDDGPDPSEMEPAGESDARAPSSSAESSSYDIE